MEWNKGLEKTHAEALRIAQELHEKREAAIARLAEELRAPAPVPAAPSTPWGSSVTQVAYDPGIAQARALIAKAGTIRAMLEPFEPPSVPTKAARGRRRA